MAKVNKASFEDQIADLILELLTSVCSAVVAIIGNVFNGITGRGKTVEEKEETKTNNKKTPVKKTEKKIAQPKAIIEEQEDMPFVFVSYKFDENHVADSLKAAPSKWSFKIRKGFEEDDNHLVNELVNIALVNQDIDIIYLLCRVVLGCRLDNGFDKDISVSQLEDIARMINGQSQKKNKTDFGYACAMLMKIINKTKEVNVDEDLYFELLDTLEKDTEDKETPANLFLTEEDMGQTTVSQEPDSEGQEQTASKTSETPKSQIDRKGVDIIGCVLIIGFIIIALCTYFYR